jgi:hypothetical protein
MITHEDIEAFSDSYAYWTEPDNHYATPMEMVKYFKKFTGQDGTPQLYSRLIMEEYDEWKQELLQINGDRTSELKELADLVYVIYGYALSKGWNLDEALYRVHVNNVLRVTQPDGTIKRREDGKIMKREDAPKVRLDDLV